MIEIVLSGCFMILLFMNVRVFLYQRTVRKISIKLGIKQDDLSVLYPKKYITMYNVSKIRWLLLAALLLFNWIYALSLFVFYYLVIIVVPEQDDMKNMKKMLVELEFDNYGFADKLRESIGKFISGGDYFGYGAIGTHLNLRMIDKSICKGVIVNFYDDKESSNMESNKSYLVRFDDVISMDGRYYNMYHKISHSELRDILEEKLLGYNENEVSY